MEIKNVNCYSIGKRKKNRVVNDVLHRRPQNQSPRSFSSSPERAATSRPKHNWQRPKMKRNGSDDQRKIGKKVDNQIYGLISIELFKLWIASDWNHGFGPTSKSSACQLRSLRVAGLVLEELALAPGRLSRLFFSSQPEIRHLPCWNQTKGKSKSYLHKKYPTQKTVLFFFLARLCPPSIRGLPAW